MPFSYQSGMRELKRLSDAGCKAKLAKRWYGWVIVDA